MVFNLISDLLTCGNIEHMYTLFEFECSQGLHWRRVIQIPNDEVAVAVVASVRLSHSA